MKSKTKKILLIFSFVFFVSGILLCLSANQNFEIVNAVERHFVYIEAKLSTNENVCFKQDDGLFTESSNLSTTKWLVVQKNDDGMITKAKKYIKVGEEYGEFPTIVAGYDEIEWKITGTSTIVDSTTKFYSNSDQNLVLNVDYHKYQIIYKNCEGAVNNNVKYYTIQNDVTINQISKIGYKFSAWIKGMFRQGKTFVISATEMQDVTLTAEWEANTYQVKFNANGGTNSMVNQNFTYGTEAELVSNTFTNGTKNFVGWATISNGSALYCDKATVSNLTAADGGIFNLYAVWSENNVYQVKFNSNGGYGHMNNQPFTELEEKPLSNVQFSRTGYEFVGWNTQSNGNGIAYENSQEVEGLSQTNNEIVELFAIWNENSYTIHFDANGGSGEMDSQELKYTQLKELYKNKFTNEDLVFACWNTKSDGTGNAYKNGQKVSRLAEDGDIILYAIWQEPAKSGLTSAGIAVIVISSIVLLGVVITTIFVKIKMNG